MSNKNKHNSIVFLTTLSVYLGLVLIGAPPILAQTTLGQKVAGSQNEVDKDKNFDKLNKLKSIDFAGTLITFAEDLRKLESIGKYNPNSDWKFKFNCRFDQALSCGNSTSYSRWTEVAILDLVNSYRESFRNFGKVNFVIKNDDPGLELKFDFSIDASLDSGFWTDQLNQSFAEKKEISREANLFYENTKATSENNQVFIVTRLPRGSLGELSKNAKAESK